MVHQTPVLAVSNLTPFRPLWFVANQLHWRAHVHIHICVLVFVHWLQCGWVLPI